MELGWIDFSKTERSKILSVLDLLSESGTLDELGIAPVRDGFSNLFFPGTTTIQTRAKYFFIVPYALKQLERSSETNPNRVFKALDAIEKTCGQTFLEQNSNENGIIGKRSLQSGGWVKRTPADIYWAGLKRYGIFTGGSLSLSEYIRISCAMKDKKTTLKKLGNRNDNAEENECDDKNAGDLFKMQFWKMPLYSDKWMENLSINLAKAEAEFLQEQIIENCKGSLLACVLEMGITEFLDCESFRDLGAIIDKFPEAVQQDYWLALAFSDFIYVIRTVYNIIISYGQNEAANDELERLKPELKELADIDVDFILNKLEVFTNPLLKKFLKQSQDLMIAGDIEGLKKCITNREVQLKGTNRAKTTHPGEFDVNEWIGGGELDYRFFNARTIVRDGGKEKATALRSHFAVAFTKGDGKEKDADRKKVIRNAFNSPFRPFVLASTSIGQEGLDFHNYCRRIVHWNLPSNPIDLEQREGRINRFECLAIRQNIAKRYGTVSFKKNIWKEMFDEAAKVENGGEGSDLIPFWGLTEKEDMVRIERIVPMYPFSRDELAYERLIKILSLYRLTLGQARQEELLEYIFKNCDDLDEMKNYFINLSPYYKKH